MASVATFSEEEKRSELIGKKEREQILMLELDVLFLVHIVQSSCGLLSTCGKTRYVNN
jgi:hypothetical protein